MHYFSTIIKVDKPISALNGSKFRLSGWRDGWVGKPDHNECSKESCLKLLSGGVLRSTVLWGSENSFRLGNKK